MFSASAFNTKRQMSLRQDTEQVCLSHFQVRFFPGLASVEQLSELKQTHTVPSGYQDPSDTLVLHSQFSQQFPHCRFTPCHFSHSCPPTHGDRLPDSLLIQKHSSFPVKEPPHATSPHGASHKQITHYQIRTAAPKLTGLEFY